MFMKKLAHALLFPHPAILLVLIPAAACFLVYSMVFLGTESAAAILSYVIAFYTLTAGCLRIPALIRTVRAFRRENKYARRWLADPRLRINVTLYGTLLWNTAYALLQLCTGLAHRSFWFGSLAAYYLTLAVMRFFLVRHTRRHAPGERMAEELRRYRICGIVFLVMNLALALMIFFMVYWNRTFRHHEITAIAMAAYTFTSLTLAIRGAVTYKKYNSPVWSAARAISLAAAAVSMLTLESTMLTAFGETTMSLAGRRILLGVSGGVISAFIIAMAVRMIVLGTKKMRALRGNGVTQ